VKQYIIWGFALVFVMVSSASGSTIERIDDLTVLKDGELIHDPLPMIQSPAKSGKTSGIRGMNDGYVAPSSGSNDVYPFDLTTHVSGTAITLTGYSFYYPYDAVMNIDGSEIWIADASADAVFVIDRATNTLLTDIPLQDYSTGVAFSGDNTLALVAERDADRIAVIDTGTYGFQYIYHGSRIHHILSHEQPVLCH